MPIEKITPGPGQESVWDYPRPPRLEDCSKRIKVVVDGVTIAVSDRARRVLETSHPPAYYLPPNDVRTDLLVPTRKQSWCEWKGQARYFDIVVGEKRIQDAAWSYPSPTRSFESIRDYLTFYPQQMDACFVGDERVQAQAGGFYGGWITSDIVGPFKGATGTRGW
jgi:uncharacterized protein (DUF427 family)